MLLKSNAIRVINTCKGLRGLKSLRGLRGCIFVYQLL